MEKLDESDIRACGGYLPLGRAGLAGGMVETENGTGLGSGTLDQVENGTGLACGTLGQTENDTGLAVAHLWKARTMRHSTSSSRPWTLGSVASCPRRERRRVVKV